MLESDEDISDAVEQQLLRDTYYVSYYELSESKYVGRWDEEKYQRCARQLYRDYLIELAYLKSQQHKRKNGQ